MLEVLEMRKLRAKKDKEEKYVSQWYWGHDWTGKKVKNFYHGPRLDWMNLFKEKKNGRLQKSV